MKSMFIYKLIDCLYSLPFLGWMFHTRVYCLKKELSGCGSVLDLGCGPNSPVQFCSVPKKVGVELFRPYLESSQRKKIHNQYILGDVTEVAFKPKSFDAVILIDVLEHLKKTQGRKLIKKMESWAKKKVILTTPNGYLKQNVLDQNCFQLHRSGWSVDELRKSGYRVYGMAGWRFLRTSKSALSWVGEKEEDEVSTIRFSPRLFWLVVSELTQIVTYFWPEKSFEIFCVKEVCK